jgi:hypothetical protein
MMSKNNGAARADDAALMSRYGIIRASVDQFRYKRYLYTRLSDALAQARRDHPSS